MTWISTCALVILALVVPTIVSVDRNKFRTCAQSAFCQRTRSVQPDNSKYRLDLDTLTASTTSVEVMLINDENNVKFRLELAALKDESFRFRIREAFPLVPRFEVPYVIERDPEEIPLSVTDQTNEGFTVIVRDTKSEAIVRAKPFAIDFYSNGVLVMSANARGMLKFEHTRRKPESENNPDTKEEENEGEADDNENGDDNEHEPGMWEESFGGNTDSKPNGPQAVAMDFSFIGSDNVYGIPEHADSFSLKDTSGDDPYRLYNLDVFEYELWNKMALYASIPFMMSHNKEHSVGLFWLNAAETWVDVRKSSSGVLGSLSNLVSSAKARVDTHFMSESGIIDVFVFLGPKPKDVVRQYGRITGTTPLPPKFSLAYHQCRWNYNDQEDVKMVNEKFDEHDIPMDVMWLDIEHTDGKKYFTWDARKFSDSLGMIKNLTSLGRKLVTIVDPHIKKDTSYWVHNDCTNLGYYVKNRDGKDYEGWCWPGASYYPDFLNPDVREYFAQQYELDRYKGTTLDVYTWNDMNEPSVFNGPEVTMPKDIVHYGGFEHRDLHNMYGHLYVMATFAGHLHRSQNTQRPFILTRSAFSGTQRYAAIWTGDNTADWGHLEAASPMCLSLSISGMTFCGADIGGFFGNPDGELKVRWYQAAAFMPFMRAHAHIDTKRREPWLFAEPEMKLMREAIRLRYSYLPLWYTLFFVNEMSAEPPMRPLWFEFPEDENTFGIDNEFMVGSSLLVRPVTVSKATDVDVYFPGDSHTYWYDIHTYERKNQPGIVNIPVTFDRIPVYQKGGTIVPKQERIRRSSPLMHNDPYTLIVALNHKGQASGYLYIDDGKSYGYRDGKYILTHFTFHGKTLSNRVQGKPGYSTKSFLERVVILGLHSDPGSALVKSSQTPLTTKFISGKDVVIIRKPGVNMGEDWDIELGV